MTSLVGALFGGGAQGPTDAEEAAQKAREEAAAKEQAKADQITALAANAQSTRKQTAYNFGALKSTLGG